MISTAGVPTLTAQIRFQPCDAPAARRMRSHCHRTAAARTADAQRLILSAQRQWTLRLLGPELTHSTKVGVDHGPVKRSPFAEDAVGERNPNEHQLQEQLRSERAQHRSNLAEKELELALVLRKLAEARLELARRDRSEAFAAAPSPSTMMH